MVNVCPHSANGHLKSKICKLNSYFLIEVIKITREVFYEPELYEIPSVSATGFIKTWVYFPIVEGN